jgi:hypothetical protein
MAIRQKSTSPTVKKETTLEVKSPQKLRHQWTDEQARRIKKMREEDKLSWLLCLLLSQAKSRKFLIISPTTPQKRFAMHTALG